MENIGLKLKQQRQSKKLTFEDINAAIRTPLKYLKALEDDDVSVFPAEVYYLGSLRRYSTYIGIDADELIGAYKHNKITAEQGAVPKKEERLGKSSKKLWIAALIVILAAALAVVIFLILKGSEVSNFIPEISPQVHQPLKQEAEKTSPPPVARTKVAKQLEQAKVEWKPAEAREEVILSNAKDAYKRYNLEVEAVNNCWIKVTTDGNTAFAATLEKGSKKQWSAYNELGLVIGYVPGVRVKLNGKELDVTAGAKQDVNELHFKSEVGQ